MSGQPSPPKEPPRTPPPTPEEIERLLRESLLLESVHDAVIVTDVSGVVTAWNAGAERFYGYPAEEAIGRHITFLRFPENLEGHRATVIEPALELGTNELVVRNRRKDGAEIFSDLRLAVVRDADGAPMRLVGFSNDVTSRINTEKALRRQEEHLRTVLDAVPAMIWYKDRNNRILTVNRAAADAMGTTIEEAAGRATQEFYPDEAAKYYQDDLDVIRSGQPKRGIVEQNQIASGEKRWVRTDKVPYLDENGDTVGVIVFAVDITERVQAESALRRAHDQLEVRVAERTEELVRTLEQLRSEVAERQRAEARSAQHQAQLAHLLRLGTVEGIAAQLAHEINQPLAAVVNFANGLKARLRSSNVDVAAMQDASEHIRQQAMRAAGVIRRLRDFVRKEPPKRQRCNLNQVVRDATRLIEAEANQCGVRVDLGLAPQPLAAVIDRVQIEQVLLNLLRNGLDAIPASGKRQRALTVGTAIAADAKFIEVRISDTGSGLPQEAETQLFEAFFTTKKHGLGMGLAISRSIIDAHGGVITATKNTPRGTTFMFTLPLARPTASRPRKKTVTRAGTKARRR